MFLDLPGLEAFLAIADLGSFHRAAERLSLSQPALTRRLQRLERVIGAELLVRTARPIRLTRAGEALLPDAQAALATLVAAMERAAAPRREPALVIGCLPTLAVRYLGPALRRHAAAWPGQPVTVFDSSASEIADMVAAGQLQFALTLVGSERWALRAEPLVDDPFCLVCPRRHRLAGQGGVRWTDVRDEALVSIGPLSGNNRLVRAALARRGIAANWRYEVRHLSTAVELVASGAALAVLPARALDPHGLRRVCAVPLSDPAITRTIGLMWPHDREPSPGATALAALLREAVQDDT